MKNPLEQLRSRVAQPFVGGLIAVLGLTACVDREENIYQASSVGGDYAILDCSELEIANRTIGQRLTGAGSYSNEGEPSTLLESQRAQITDVRTTWQCPGESSVLAATPTEVIEAPSEDLLLENANYLQIATFREETNRDATVAKLRAMGFETSVLPIQLAGQTFYRVVVGPLTSINDVARIDAAAIGMGFNDTLFLEGMI